VKKIVFLDRDGVINRDSSDYIKNWREFEFLPGSLRAIRSLCERGFVPIVVTNQSGLNRGLVSPEDIEEIHSRMKAEIAARGGELRDIFLCPHLPEEGCACRKPLPGLILAAKEKHSIDLASACMIGDSAKDIACARNAGCGVAVLVRTGHGREAEKILARMGMFPDHVARDLLDAALWLIRRDADGNDFGRRPDEIRNPDPKGSEPGF
jgi:D-glycero-D-manno-heptose 1,7-bisphosphate phosphatase